jgi:predicted ArsR family transcriptional regulator
MPKHVRTLKAKRRERILPFLVKLLKKGQATASQIGSSPVDIRTIEAEGLVRRVDVVRTGRRGRPAVVYRLTDNGRKRARRAVTA